MKKVFLFLVLALVTMAAVCFGADAIAPVVATPASVGFLDWFKQNTALVLGVALAISELLAQIPTFKGNGIVDTIIKALRVLSEKPKAE